jgi:predicted DsbA family dithiol-disulfide isomerase
LTLEELFAGRPVNIQEMKTRMKKVATDLGLPWGERTRTYNSRLAQELAKWAEEKGRGGDFHEAVFRAYFVEAKNIAKRTELVALAKNVGLPGKEAGEVLERRICKKAVDEDWRRSHELGITAVPTFVLYSRVVVGAQPYEVLEHFLEENNIKRK